jgi:hypothetical protein
VIPVRRRASLDRSPALKFCHAALKSSNDQHSFTKNLFNEINRLRGSLRYYVAIILRQPHNEVVAVEIEFTDEFERWWNGLLNDEQDSVRDYVQLLGQYGVNLGFPHSSGIASSRHGHMRELRVQHEGRPYRVLYAFNPLRAAILLLGGDKTGDDRWYERFVPVADRLYDEHLEELKKEGLL